MDKNSPPGKEKDKNFKEIRRVWGQAEAEVIRNFLENQGLHCILSGRIVQSVVPCTVDGLGEIKILVFEDEIELAESLLKEYQE